MERSAKQNIFLLIIGSVVFGLGCLAFANAQVVGVTLPSVPTNVSASVGSAPGQISVSWGASTESSGTIEGYYIYRNGTQVANTAGTSYIDAGLPSGFYSYAVSAYDANGYQSPQSSVASVTLIADTTPPTAPTGVTISGATTTNSYYSKVPITISWGASTDNVAVVGYYVYRNGTPITSSTAAFTGTSISDTVGPGTYTYTVSAYDAAQNISNRSAATTTISIDNVAPSSPTHVSAQQISASGAEVSWATSTDDNSVAGYQIFRNGIQIASTTGSPYTDGGLSANVQYSYTVTAYDIAGNISSPSQPVANITIQPFTGPVAPIITGTTLTGTSTIFISWAPGADPLAITGYAIYRDGTPITSVTSTSYFDAGLSAGTHTYNLSETDVSGAVSPISATSTVLIPVIATSTTPTVALSSDGSISARVTVTEPTLPSVASSTAASMLNTIFTQFLYYGLRGEQVTALQTLLAQNGYIDARYATGFFGTLTLDALEKFQCDHAIVCTGGAGWGIVGPKTRAALNALEDAGATSAGGAAITTANTSSPTSTSAMLAEIQTLQAMLANLEKQLSTAGQ